MSEILVIVDDGLGIRPVVETVLKNTEARILGAEDTTAAKRVLLQVTPNLIVSRIAFRDDAQGGLRLCQELRAHAALACVPVILFEKDIDDGLIRRASEAGAQGLMSWPASVIALRHRFSAHLNCLTEVRELPQLTKSEIKPEEAAGKPKANVPSQPDKAPARIERRSDPSRDEKIQYAQSLLARILHDLKTSDLLEIVEKEDVPRVVFEITRSVCGFKGLSGAPLSGVASEKETKVDLADAFGLKK